MGLIAQMFYDGPQSLQVPLEHGVFQGSLQQTVDLGGGDRALLFQLAAVEVNEEGDEDHEADQQAGGGADNEFPIEALREPAHRTPVRPDDELRQLGCLFGRNSFRINFILGGIRKMSLTICQACSVWVLSCGLRLVVGIAKKKKWRRVCEEWKAGPPGWIFPLVA